MFNQHRGVLVWAKNHAHLIKESGPLEEPQELKIVERKNVPVFVVDKRKRKTCRSS